MIFDDTRFVTETELQQAIIASTAVSDDGNRTKHQEDTKKHAEPAAPYASVVYCLRAPTPNLRSVPTEKKRRDREE